MNLDDELMAILACPACKGSLEKDGEQLVCQACRFRYPIRDGIPLLLVDEAEHPADDSL